MESSAVTLKFNTHYYSAGEGEPVLLVHGWPTSSFLWRNMIEPLAQIGKKVITVDLPGYGKSDKPRDVVYSHQYLADFIERFLEALDIQKTAIIAHDIGVPTVLLWAIRHPDKLERLVLTNSVFYPENCVLLYTRNVSWIKRLWQTIFYPKGSKKLKMIGILIHTPGLRRLFFNVKGLKKTLKKGFYNKEIIGEDLLTEYIHPFTGKNASFILTKTFLDLYVEELEIIPPNISKLEMPVLLMYGEQDEFLPAINKQFVDLKKQLSNASIYAVSNAGHYLMEDQPEIVSQKLTMFMEEILPPKSHFQAL
jgi:pimeloyl-ACP methyl ester carboxylesterase